jgi:glucokinase
MILAGDIGGTKVHLAFFEMRGPGLAIGVLDTFKSHEFKSLSAIVHAFVTTRKLNVECACFGVAGPVRGGRVEVTNLPWVIDSQDLARELNLKQAWLINDLEANAHGIAGLAPQDFVELNRGEANTVGNVAILSAGTGLGEAGLVWDGNRHLAIPSEGGHADFAPRTDVDMDLLRYLRRKLGQVSWENVLSGPGMLHVYEFLRDTSRASEPAWLKDEMARNDPPAVITRTALEGKSDLCAQALELFINYYGMEAGNLGLKMLATGGVYLGGGIAPRIVNKLREGGFLRAYIGQGRMKNLLAAMPVRVIMNDKAALIGAARYAAIRAGKTL